MIGHFTWPCRGHVRRTWRLRWGRHFCDMLYFLSKPSRSLFLRLPREQLGIILEHERTRSASRDDCLIRFERCHIESRPVLHQIDVSVGLNRGSRTSLGWKRGLDPLLPQHTNHRVTHTVIKILRGATMEVGDLRPAGWLRGD